LCRAIGANDFPRIDEFCVEKLCLGHTLIKRYVIEGSRVIERED